MAFAYFLRIYSAAERPLLIQTLNSTFFKKTEQMFLYSAVTTSPSGISSKFYLVNQSTEEYESSLPLTGSYKYNLSYSEFWCKLGEVKLVYISLMPLQNSESKLCKKQVIIMDTHYTLEAVAGFYSAQ